jgi:hypothetical protein
MKCETCQEEATIYDEVLGCHFCASCLKKIDERVAEINDTKKRSEKPNQQLVSGPHLLEVIFESESRPTLRWLRDQTRLEALPFVRQGRLIFCDPNQVREHMKAAGMQADNTASAEIHYVGRLVTELRQWLDSQDIHGDNIGSIRRQCFLPWDSPWNALVRDETAKREKGTK